MNEEKIFLFVILYLNRKLELSKTLHLIQFEGQKKSERAREKTTRANTFQTFANA